MSRNRLILLAAGGSALMLLAAMAFQHLGGMAPCKLCIWQRWPHAVAVGIGLGAMLMAGRLLPLSGALAALITAAFGLYHTGVEKGWWEGPTSCSSGGLGDLSATELFDQIMAAPLVRCDEVVWQMLGLSMASWNAVVSLGLATLWLIAARRS